MGKNVLLAFIAALLGSSTTNARHLRRQEDGTETRNHRRLQGGDVIDVSMNGLDHDSFQEDWSTIGARAGPAASPIGDIDYHSSAEIETGGPFLGPEVLVEPKKAREGRGDVVDSSSSKRIIGGFDADPHPFHSMLLLRYGGGWRWMGCGATLVSNCHVVTAAHCAADPTKPPGAVFVNAHRPYQENFDVPFHFSEVSHVIRHAGFNATTNANDIAVIKMAECLNITEFPPAIPANSNMDIPSTLMADILGFGKQSELGNLFVNVQALQMAQVPIISQDTCKEYYGDKIKNDMFCGGYAQGGVDACQGDSGSSMTYVDQDERAVFIGVISWGVGCGRSNSPGVYASVQYHYDWLARQVCTEQDTNVPWCSTYVVPPTPTPSATPSVRETLQPTVATASSTKRGSNKERTASNFYSESSTTMIVQSRMDTTSSSSSSTATIGNPNNAEEPSSHDSVVQFWDTPSKHSGCKPSGSQCWMGNECCSGNCQRTSSVSHTMCLRANAAITAHRRKRTTRGVRATRRSGN